MFGGERMVGTECPSDGMSLRWNVPRMLQKPPAHRAVQVLHTRCLYTSVSGHVMPKAFQHVWRVALLDLEEEKHREVTSDVRNRIISVGRGGGVVFVEGAGVAH